MKLFAIVLAVLGTGSAALLSVKSDACAAEDLKHRVMLQNKLAGDCEEMCKEVGAYPKGCTCPGFVQPDSTPGVMTWDELLAHMDNLVAWGKETLKGWTSQAAAAALAQKKITAGSQAVLDSKACATQDLQHRAQVQNKLASACVDMCKEIGAYPKCECPDFAPPDSTPGVMTWDELLEHMDNLVAWGSDMIKKAKSRASGLIQQNRSHWAPQPCDELEPGVPCTKLYKHPAGSGTVMPCPGKTQTRPDGCAALFKGKADGEQCPQIYCPKALGKTMKLVCAGGCCPTCWAPDHVVAVDRHASIDNAKTVPVAPMAPKHCTEPGPAAKCFEPKCDEGFKKGFVQGDCCYSCVPGR